MSIIVGPTRPAPLRAVAPPRPPKGGSPAPRPCGGVAPVVRLSRVAAAAAWLAACGFHAARRRRRARSRRSSVCGCSVGSSWLCRCPVVVCAPACLPPLSHGRPLAAPPARRRSCVAARRSPRSPPVRSHPYNTFFRLFCGRQVPGLNRPYAPDARRNDRPQATNQAHKKPNPRARRNRRAQGLGFYGGQAPHAPQKVFMPPSAVIRATRPSWQATRPA